MIKGDETAFVNGFKPGKTYTVPEIPQHILKKDDLDLPRSLDSMDDGELSDNTSETTNTTAPYEEELERK